MTATPAEFLIAFSLAAAIGTAVFFHAERNQIKHPSLWASFVFLFLIVGLPTYVIHVRPSSSAAHLTAHVVARGVCAVSLQQGVFVSTALESCQLD